MDQNFLLHLQNQTKELHSEGLYKEERIITSQQQAEITVSEGKEKSKERQVINLCANNYLGLANNKELIDAAKNGLDKHGFGMASVRFICGTQDIHKTLEKSLSNFLKTEDTILYSSCFDANGGLFETLFQEDDAIISDALNHASIIDGVRLSKAQRFRYKNNDMTDLENQLKAAKSCRFKVIATDGVFSMDGTIANLKAICDLADSYGALVMVDDSHAVGFIGEKGGGTPEYCKVQGRIDMITGTLGKALGGASGGYTSGRYEIVEWLRQRSRPYLFSNTLAPSIAAASIKVLDMLKNSDELRIKLKNNSQYFREKMTKLGFNLVQGDHPIIPIMLGDATLAGKMAKMMLDEGIYVVGFSFPVVPKNQARIRTQMSAAHDKEHLDRAISAFEKVGKMVGVI
ncbi:MAG: glycine C-acetyltransferase [Desulfamplus sp.]|nr:glycine C-acetyltransferase [Desulfamplus sp.]